MIRFITKRIAKRVLKGAGQAAESPDGQEGLTKLIQSFLKATNENTPSPVVPTEDQTINVGDALKSHHWR